MYNLPSVVQEARVAINEVELKLGFQHRAGFGSCRQTLPMVMQNRSFQRSTVQRSWTWCGRLTEIFMTSHVRLHRQSS